MGGIGGFGALCELPTKIQEPKLYLFQVLMVLVLNFALLFGSEKHDTIGIDLVAMCVNDLIVQGGEPLFFLDYYATGKLDVDSSRRCFWHRWRLCASWLCTYRWWNRWNAGHVRGDDYDVAGFCVGVVEKADIIDGTKVAAGDALIAVGSSGPHSNGYSLIRKVLEVSGADKNEELEGRTIGEHLLEPTKIYIKSALKMIAEHDIHAISHITGGGFWENIHAYFLKVLKQWLMVRAGNGLLSSTGYKRKATWKHLKCTALSTVV